MSADFLTILAARTLGLTPIIQPAIASFFAPQYNMIEEGRGEDSLIYNNDANSSTLTPSSSLVAAGNSSAEISRLPYSQIIANAPDREVVNSPPVISSQLTPDDLQLQMGESAIAFSTEPLNNTENSNLIPSSTPQNIVQRQVDAVTPLSSPSVISPNSDLRVSESVTPLVEPVISQVNLPAQTPNQETSNFQQSNQNIDAEIFTNAVEVSQPELTVSSPVILPINSVTPVVSESENQQLLNSQQKDNLNSEFSPSTASPPSVLPLNTVTPVSSLENQPNLISPHQDESATLKSNVSPPSILNSNAVIPGISPSENQQLLNSQPKDNFNSEFSASTASPQSLLPLNTVTPVSSLENQPNLISPRQDESATLKSNLSLPSILNSNAVTPGISASENQQLLNSQPKDNFNSEFSASTASPQSVLPVNTVKPVISSLENQPNLISLRQEESVILKSNLSPPSILNSNAVTPAISASENQQLLVPPEKDNLNSKSSPLTASPQSVLPANTIIPIVSSLENQANLTSLSQNTPDFQPSALKVVSSLENQQSFVSQREDKQNFQSSASKVSPQFLVPENSVKPIVSSLENQNTLISSHQNGSTPSQVSLQSKLIPLVDKRMLKNDRSLESWDLQTRLPSEIIIAQNETKIKPLVTISQKRSLDFENDSQFTSKRELGKSTSETAPPTVQVTIGKIEVRSAPAPTAPTANKKSSSRQPSVSLQDYLKQRQGGKL